MVRPYKKGKWITKDYQELKILERTDKSMETRVYQFIGTKKDLDTLEQIFRHIEYLGDIGASRNILIRIDGDGSGRIKVINKDGNKLDNKTYNIKQTKEDIYTVGIYDIG